ncbi:DUF2497 domain-containing protein [Novosphingobium sp. FKTRR1]|uniref:DUF2497 domain-containing protein n=1 Tax=Novosphingobium sp. FKTRR1 TaxID=2879118 RepID=UPI001CF0B8B3|nr:DUF2497 domain-containing protein [Novosphingobium sp. FKTRR1]
MRQAGEPSVEEILDSIKKVIARDNRADASLAKGRRDTIAPAVNPDAMAQRHGDVLDLSEVAAQILGESPAAAYGAARSELADDAEPLLQEAATASMRQSLEALALLSQPGARPQIVRSGETSLEGLVREMLRPMLAEWLDRNLPGMVEKLVATEIARIVGKRG